MAGDDEHTDPAVRRARARSPKMSTREYSLEEQRLANEAAKDEREAKQAEDQARRDAHLRREQAADEKDKLIIQGLQHTNRMLIYALSGAFLTIAVLVALWAGGSMSVSKDGVKVNETPKATMAPKETPLEE